MPGNIFLKGSVFCLSEKFEYNKNMYRMNVKARYSETDQENLVHLHHILNYFQDCGIFHSMSLGLGKIGAEEENRAWWLLAWNVNIDRYPALGDHLTVITEPYAMHGFYGYRRYMILDEEEQVLARANSIWIFIDTKNMIPLKIPETLAARFMPQRREEKINIKRKLSLKGNWKERETFPVTKFFLDSNGHVNNANYVIWAEEILPDGFIVDRLKVDYRQAAYLNDVIKMCAIEEEDGFRVRFMNQKGELAAIVELQGRAQ